MQGHPILAGPKAGQIDSHFPWESLGLRSAGQDSSGHRFAGRRFSSGPVSFDLESCPRPLEANLSRPGSDWDRFRFSNRFPKILGGQKNFRNEAPSLIGDPWRPARRNGAHLPPCRGVRQPPTPSGGGPPGGGFDHPPSEGGPKGGPLMGVPRMAVPRTPGEGAPAWGVRRHPGRGPALAGARVGALGHPRRGGTRVREGQMAQAGGSALVGGVVTPRWGEGPRVGGPPLP